MKTVIAYVFVLIETIGIIAISIVYARKATNLNSIEIHIPTDMYLTTNKDISITTPSEPIVLPKDTVVIPDFVFPNNTVYFHYEGIEEMLSASWDSFNEREQLESLKINAEHDLVEKNERNKFRIIVMGIVVGITWLVLGGGVSRILIKKDKDIIVVIINAVAIIIVFIYLFSLNAYLWH